MHVILNLSELQFEHVFFFFLYIYKSTRYHSNLGGVTITVPPVPGQPAPVFMTQPMQQMPPGFAPGYAAGPMM